MIFMFLFYFRVLFFLLSFQAPVLDITTSLLFFFQFTPLKTFNRKFTQNPDKRS
jgi:hypothetical protein